MEPHDIGYVRLTQFTENADSSLRDAITHHLKKESGGQLQALILDLRNNPGGLLDQAVAVSSDFVDHGEIVSTRGRHADDLRQRWDAECDLILISAFPRRADQQQVRFARAEIVSGALQDHLTAPALIE